MSFDFYYNFVQLFLISCIKFQKCDFALYDLGLCKYLFICDFLLFMFVFLSNFYYLLKLVWNLKSLVYILYYV